MKPVSSHVTVKVKLPASLRFRNEKRDDMSTDMTLLTKNLGTISDLTKFTFEFEMRTVSELIKLSIGLDNI